MIVTSFTANRHLAAPVSAALGFRDLTTVNYDFA